MTKPIGCGLLAALLLAFPLRAADVDKLLPDDVGAVVHLNVRQVLDSALMKKYGLAPAQAAVKSGEFAEKWLTPAGFDPLHDATSVTAVFPADNDPQRGLVIVRGKFDRDRITRTAARVAGEKGSPVKVLDIDGQSVYEISSAAKEQGSTAFVAVLDGQTVVAAPDRASIEEALAKQSSKRVGKIQRFLRKMIEEEDANQSLWVVVPEGKFLSGAKLAADDKVKEVVGRIDFLRLGVTVSDSVKVKATVAARSAEDAAALKKDFDGGLESAKGVVALVGDSRPELAPLGAFLDTIALKNLGKVLLLEGTASATVIDKTLEKAIRPAGRP
ncbi:hypothetical protein AYO40_00835 [Planctomycetaceae bacterium SCGC AG-212-D15]|nr:hypothetical protein AYO40_00835 [Planctomycetaceae bacterium SCGC AG-212-D15]